MVIIQTHEITRPPDYPKITSGTSLNHHQSEIKLLF